LTRAVDYLYRRATALRADSLSLHGPGASMPTSAQESHSR
jgi:hypothetical protein